MVALLEAVLSILTLGGYWMVTHGFVFWGAFVGLLSNILWVFYGIDKNRFSPSIIIVNFVFAMINISLISN